MKPQLVKQSECRLSDNNYMRVLLSFTGLLAPKFISTQLRAGGSKRSDGSGASRNNDYCNSRLGAAAEVVNRLVERDRMTANRRS